MSACPHCGGEIRPSVIKCVHCGTPLIGDPQPSGAVSGGPAQAAVVAASTPASPPTSAPAPVTSKPPGMPGRPPAPPPSVFDPPHARTDGDPCVTPSVRADALLPLPQSAVLASSSAPAAKTRRANVPLMGAGVLAIASAVAASTALSLPWVTGSVWITGDRPSPRSVAELTFHGSDSFAGRVAVAAAVVMGLLGLLWFWYGMDRGVNLPRPAHPGIALVIGGAAAGALATVRLGTAFWEPAFVAHAREAGLTKGGMRAILEDAAARRIDLVPQTGMVRFAAATALAVVAGIIAWWSQRARAFR